MLVICKIFSLNEAKERIEKGLPTFACIDAGETLFYLNANNEKLFKAYTKRFGELENDKSLFFTDKVAINETKMDLSAGEYFCDEFYEYEDAQYGHPAIEEITDAKTIYKNWGHTEKEYKKMRGAYK